MVPFLHGGAGVSEHCDLPVFDRSSRNPNVELEQGQSRGDLGWFDALRASEPRTWEMLG